MAVGEPETPPATPSAAPAGRKKLLVLVIVAVLIVAGLGVVAYVLLTGGQPPAPTLDHVTVTLTPSSVDQLGVLSLAATAFDSNNNNVTAETNFTWTATPVSAVGIVQVPPARTAQAVALQSGSVTISASGTWHGSSRSGSAALSVVALSLELTPSASAPLVGAPFDLAVRVLRTGGAVATTYQSMIHFTSDDAGATLPAPYTFTPTDAGVRTFTGLNVSRSGAIQISAADMIVAQIAGTATVTGNRIPTAAFVITPDAVDPATIDVDGSTSSDPDTGDSIASYTWNFGDGTPVVGPQVSPLATHTYAGSGTYTITLTVADTHAATDDATQPFTVGAVPVADFIVTSMELSGPDVLASVDASASSDSDGTIVSYNWTWGDGTFSEVSTPTTTHLYDSTLIGQDVTIVLRVTDDDGYTGTFQRTVNVNVVALPPVASFVITSTDQLTRTVSVDASASSDPNGNLQYYNWTWGDGTWTNDTTPIATHSYLSDTTFTVNLTVVDSTNLVDWMERQVTIAGPTFAYNYYDFFNVDYGDWWDYRYGVYGDLAIGADCFNATAVAYGVCTPANPAIPDTASYPYTNWYPLPGSIKWDNPNNVPIIYAPYRFNVTAARVPGYNSSEPVFLPVLNYSAAPGAYVDFEWQQQYLDIATSDYLTDVVGCPGVASSTQDGFKLRAQIRLTMDLQSSRRIFGVSAADATAAQAWWTANTNPQCGLRGPVETAYQDWFYAMGGTATAVGKYDIYNSFEWYYQVFYVNMTATVDPDGTTHIDVDTAAFGPEVLLARMFYWGNASYRDNYLDSTKARGWWGMELAWLEEMMFRGRLGPENMDFFLKAAMQYHFQQLAMPGPNGYLDRSPTAGTPSLGDDIPYWTWGPILTDYTNDATPRHLESELDRYPSPEYGYLHATPGGMTYNRTIAYDYPPIRWDLKAAESLHFQFPTGNVIFYDPNLTPVPANPTSTNHVPIYQPLKYHSTNPSGYGTWNAAAFTWDVVGPTATGGPVGSPGPDGTPGTADDEYALEPWGSIRFVPEVFPLALRTLTSVPDEPALAPSSTDVTPSSRITPVSVPTFEVVARVEPASGRYEE